MGVTEPDIGSDIVGGEPDGSDLAGDRDTPIRMYGGDCPVVSVLDHMPLVGLETTVVASSDHFISNMESLSTDADAWCFRVEFSDVLEQELGVPVEPVHGFVPVGHERNAFASLPCCPPCPDDLGFHLRGGAAVESTMPIILGEGVWIAVAEFETGLALPFMVEPVYLFQFCCSVGVDQVGEHSASSDG